MKKEENKKQKYCLLIDSGTTMYHLFCEICKRTEGENKEIWKERVFIITNNLPGIQYLMKHCKEGSNEYADVSVNCLILPGTPLSVYAAVTGNEACNFLEEKHIKPIIEKRLNAKEGEYKIISFITGNYIVRHKNSDNEIDSYCPVARGGGHYDVKTKFAKLSQQIYLISPLTKFSFATWGELNNLNGFEIDEEKEPEKAKDDPSKVMYREIEIIDEKRDICTFITTKREKGKDMFGDFAEDLIVDLERMYGDRATTAKFKLEKWIPANKDEKYAELELEREIPHESLRDVYLEMNRDGYFIWDKKWKNHPRERKKKNN